jgi:hypothetical protein
MVAAGITPVLAHHAFAAEFDEKEEFPWPVVQEAAKIGLYGMDFMANAMMGDPTGLTLPVAIEEMFHPATLESFKI